MILLQYLFVIMMLFSFSGCELFEDSEQLQAKKQELALKKLQVEQEKALADLEMKKSLALIEKEKALESLKLQNEIKEKELSANSEKELELIKQKVALQESNNLLDFQKYLLLFLGVLTLLVAAFVFFYLKRKREDELRAYNDNLKKYFYFKENEARLKIAEKILETVSKGDLSKENQQKLISAFASQQHDYDTEIITDVLPPVQDGNSVEADVSEEKGNA